MMHNAMLQALLSVLRCPACSDSRWEVTTGGEEAVLCLRCHRAHRLENGVLHVNVLHEHHEVQQERASVPATEGSAVLGGWREEGYAPGLDPASPLGQAYLSLPYGNDSYLFHEPGYFQNVHRFAAEFDFILSHLPRSGLLLDVGADGTWSTAQLSRRGLTCVALDITDHLTLARLFQTACPPYALVNVDMHEPAFIDDAFDVVTAFNALHHSTRLDSLAQNIGRVLKPGGIFGFVEPYVQNAQQEAAFGAPQSAMGINEHVHTHARWHEAFTAAGLVLEAYSVSDSLNGIYRRPDARVPLEPSPGDVLATFYEARVEVTPTATMAEASVPVHFSITVHSLGRAAWASRGPLPVRLSYHVSRVTSSGSELLAFDNERTLLPAFVGRGSPATFSVRVTLSEPGDYAIEFDLVHETIAWFKDRGGQTATARVTIR